MFIPIMLIKKDIKAISVTEIISGVFIIENVKPMIKASILVATDKIISVLKPKGQVLLVS